MYQVYAAVTVEYSSGETAEASLPNNSTPTFSQGLVKLLFFKPMNLSIVDQVWVNAKQIDLMMTATNKY